VIWSKKVQKQNLLGIKYIQLLEPVKGIASFKR
jgi:hypothetical protein